MSNKRKYEWWDILEKLRLLPHVGKNIENMECIWQRGFDNDKVWLMMKNLEKIVISLKNWDVHILKALLLNYVREKYFARSIMWANGVWR